MPSLKLHGREVQMADLSVEELQSNIAACQLMFPKWRSGYNVILADPPWQYNTMYQSLQGVVPYPTMSWEELADMPIGKLADPKMCAIFLWATGPLIHKTIALMEHWGFEYKTVFKTWRKTNADGSPVCSPGWWSRSSCEFLLVGTKGSGILKYKTTNSERQEYASVREGHSAKPAAITQSIADFLAVPGPRIELWARESHPLFDSWGLEVPGFFATASKSTKARVCAEPIEEELEAAPVLPLPKSAKKASKAHSHLALLKEQVAASPPESTPPKPSPKPAPKRQEQSLSQDESWALLAKMNPSKGKKRKTVHKPGCKCFVCVPKKKVGSHPWLQL